MSFTDITSSNIPSSIEQFKYDIRRYEEKFDGIEKEIVELECSLNRAKNDISDRFSYLNKKYLNYNLSLESLKLDQISSFLFVKEKLEQELTIDVVSHTKLIKDLDDLFIALKESQESFNMIEGNILNELKRKEDSNQQSALINPHIVHCRQTNKPFILTEMNPSSRYQCNGCRTIISLQLPYLKHLEEYPAGSKILRPHSYHIAKKCISGRGFQLEYLRRIKVICEQQINDDIMRTLEDIGFQSKNVQTKDDSDCDSDGSDAMSQHSATSSLAESSEYVLFTLRRKHATQKKKVVCAGCDAEIMEDTFLTRGNKFDHCFHINKKCVQIGGSMSSDFSHVRCMVAKLLRSHNELTQLLACGFYYKNILGNKPQNPNRKAKPIPPKIRQANSLKPSLKDVGFIFNNEAFTCQRLLHGEKCQGCSDQVRKEEMVLRHREKVPRDRLVDAPLVSQFYHVRKNCLVDRGFSDKYIERSTCNVELSGSDNVQIVRDMLMKCGFDRNNLKFGSVEAGSRQTTIPNSIGLVKNPNESFLFIVNCTKTMSHCEGCGFNVAVNHPCYVYGQSDEQDRNARLFHISQSCLLHHFSKEQLLSMLCINSNSMVDVSPGDILRCGIVNIKTSLEPSKLRRKHTNPFRSVLPQFVVTSSLQYAGHVCPGCNQPLQQDKYTLTATTNDDQSPSIVMHVRAACVKKCGHLPQQVSRCDLIVKVALSSMARQQLQECGFQRIPRVA